MYRQKSPPGMTAAKRNKSPMDKIYLHTYIHRWRAPYFFIIWKKKKKRKRQHYMLGVYFSLFSILPSLACTRSLGYSIPPPKKTKQKNDAAFNKEITLTQHGT